MTKNKFSYARHKGMVTERIGKAFLTMKFREKDKKYQILHLQSKNHHESAGIVDSIAVKKKKDLNKLEIVLIERKCVSEKGYLPKEETDIKIKKRLKKACKMLDIKYGIFRQKKGDKIKLIIIPYKS